ncbi:uncharacterized protein [Aristolochia californica]|uniref:uncharacterized protein isoform X2 n=1 Tax=Aristolochia californica TaxID=171875 RepID=UPI0035E3405D
MPKDMEGIASIALLPSGSISGHFISLPDSVCYGLHGTELACERECSRGEDYRFIKLTIFDYASKRERAVVVECRGHDAARFRNVDHAHGAFAYTSIIRTNQSEGLVGAPRHHTISNNDDNNNYDNNNREKRWEKDVVGMVEQKHEKQKILISFECETLKADMAADDHIRKFMPNVSGLDAVVNVGRMSMSGLDFESEDESK